VGRNTTGISHFHLDHALLPQGWERAVAVSVRNGMIEAVDADAAPPAGAERLAGAALPGLPNLHSHCFQRGMAGLAERRGPASDSFWTWRQVMYRFLERLDPDDVEAVAALAMVEMLEGGFTSLAEFHYLHHAPGGVPYADRAELAGRIVAAAEKTGLALTLLPVFYAHGGFGGAEPVPGQRRFLNDLDGFLSLREAAAAKVSAIGGVIGAAPHSLRAVTPDELDGLLRALPDGPLHIHIAEQMREVEECLAWSGRRPVEWLLEHAAVDGRWCLIHATHLTAGERDRIAASGAVAGLCPITEANLGDGLFDAAAYLARGGLIGVGSDSNVEISAPGELRLLEYGQRLAHRGRNLLAAREGQSTGEALYLAALAGGARALGQPVGAIAPGHAADFVVLDTRHPTLAAQEPAHWLDTYVFAAGAPAIDRVIVRGRTVVSSGRHVAGEVIRRHYVERMRRLM